MKIITISFLVAVLCACGNTTVVSSAEAAKTEKTSTEKTWPTFCADSAYRFVAEQVEIGPRVPGTASHIRCRDYIAGKMKQFVADTVFFQSAKVTAFDGKQLPMHNIIARFNTKAPKRS